MTDIEQIKNNSFFEGYKQATEQANGCIKQIRAEIDNIKVYNLNAHEITLINAYKNRVIDIIDKCTGGKAK